MAVTDAPDPQDLADLIDLNTRIAIRTTIPGIVTGIRKVGNRIVCSVQLSPKQALRDGRYQDIVEVDRVPIGWLTGGGMTIRCTLDIGDGCMCMVSDRTLDGFLTGGGQTYRPRAGDTHNPRDMVALPILTPDSKEPLVDVGAKELYIGDANGKTSFFRLNAANGTLTAESTTKIDINCQGPANVNSPAVTLGSAGAQAPIARVGLEQVIIPAGSSAGTYPIVSALGSSAHTTKG